MELIRHDFTRPTDSPRSPFPRSNRTTATAAPPAWVFDLMDQLQRLQEQNPLMVQAMRELVAEELGEVVEEA